MTWMNESMHANIMVIPNKHKYLKVHTVRTDAQELYIFWNSQLQSIMN